jgi:transposase
LRHYSYDYLGDDPVSKGAQRFEVFTGAGKRRDWPPEVKASIVAECYAGGEGVSAVARRHGLDPSQIYAWRKSLHQQLVDQGLAPSATEPVAVTFVPALIEPAAPSTSVTASAPHDEASADGVYRPQPWNWRSTASR